MPRVWSTKHTFDEDTELAICIVCHCAEGTLPQHCPGERVSEERQQEIYTARLQFVGGIWWRPEL